MMNKKALIPLALAAVIALGGTGGAVANAAAQRAATRHIHIGSGGIVSKPTASPIASLPAVTRMPETTPMPEAVIPEYIAPEGLPKVLGVSGTIADLTTRDDGATLVVLQHDEGGETHVIVGDATYLVPGTELAIGASFTGWYDAMRPMTLQYPPRYTALAARTGGAEELPVVKIDIFDEDQLSSDGELKLNIAEDAVIVDREGNAYEGALDGRLLAVTYTFTTLSIPAQTSPERIVVLDAAE